MFIFVNPVHTCIKQVWYIQFHTVLGLPITLIVGLWQEPLMTDCSNVLQNLKINVQLLTKYQELVNFGSLFIVLIFHT